jgi:imidazolonepropionase-like amidohydrolase
MGLFLLRISFVSIFIFFFHQPLMAQSLQVERIVLEHINIVDIKNGNILRTKTVEIESGIIIAIRNRPRSNYPVNTLVVDAGGKYLVPGLWDMHVHVTQRPFNDPKKTFALMIANGVTGIRDMGGYLSSIKKWKSEISANSLIGPRIAAAGPILFATRSAGPGHIGIPSAEKAAGIVDSLKEAGADFIKVYNFISRESYYAIADETKKLKIPLTGHIPMAITASEASDAGQKSIEHLDFPFFIQECAREFTKFRQADIAREYQLSRPFDTASTIAFMSQLHDLDSALFQFDQKKADSIYSHFVMNHTWQCPTLISLKMFANRRDSSLLKNPLMKYAYSPFIPRDWDYKKSPITAAMKDDEWNIAKRLYSAYMRIATDMKKKGVPFLAGTDVGTAFIYPGFSLHEELRLFVQIGFTPLEALQTATINPALFFDKEDSLGTVNPGKYADLVILKANPLKDISNLQLIEAVIVNGRYLDRKRLDKLLESVAEK